MQMAQSTALPTELCMKLCELSWLSAILGCLASQCPGACSSHVDLAVQLQQEQGNFLPLAVSLCSGEQGCELQEPSHC